MDLRILEDLGLSNAEAKIYYALLELGQSKTGQIIDKTKLQSSTVYHVLGSLIEKGIVSHVHIGKVKYYQAESPENLMHFLEEKKKNLQTILPELKEKEIISKQKQSAKVYEGIKGMTAAFNDILETMNPGEEYYFFQFPPGKLEEPQIKRFFKKYHMKRSEKGIKVKGIADPRCKKQMKEIYTLPHTETRFLDNPSPNVAAFYKGKIIYVDWEDVPTAFTITSQSMYELQKNFFLEKWEIAK